MSKLKLRDPTVVIAFPVKFFHRMAAELPCIQGPGDVVMLHDIKVSADQDELCPGRLAYLRPLLEPSSSTSMMKMVG